MIFSSVLFTLFFLPSVFLGLLFCWHKKRNEWLLLVSLLFYFWGAPLFIFVVVFSAILDFWIAQRFLQASTPNTTRQRAIFLGVFFNVALLAYFKYANFFVDNLDLLAFSFWGTTFTWAKVALPLGISFYTFQKISFLLDVYQHPLEKRLRFRDYLLFVMLFPQLVAGPILQYRQIEGDLLKIRPQTLAQVEKGLSRFVFGLAKKVLIADTLATIADAFYNGNLSHITVTESWVCTLAYTLQIYYDFSGYSDMAIGLGLIFGFTIPENFTRPYLSKSIREFWLRWHMTLGSWMKKYLYLPLGGNRLGEGKTIRNLWIVFLFSGLWHGAGWNFILWGAVHGFFLTLERFLPKPKKSNTGSVLATFYCFMVAHLSWVLFRADSFTDAFSVYKHMFWGTWGNGALLDSHQIFILIFAFTTLFVPQKIGLWLRESGTVGHALPRFIHSACVLFIFVLCLGTLGAKGFNPFIYFRF